MVKAQYGKGVESADSDEVAIDGDLIQGSKIFTKNCMNCHNLNPSSTGSNSTGPSLGLIYLRKAGSDVSFPSYSKGMLDSEFYWDSKNLSSFLAAPNRFVPGSKCNFVNGGLINYADRVDVIK